MDVKQTLTFIIYQRWGWSYRDVHSAGCSLQTRDEGGQDKHRRVCQHHEGGPYEYGSKRSEYYISFLKNKTFLIQCYFLWHILKIYINVLFNRVNTDSFTMFCMKHSSHMVQFYPKRTSQKRWSTRCHQLKLWTCHAWEKSLWFVKELNYVRTSNIFLSHLSSGDLLI